MPLIGFIWLRNFAVSPAPTFGFCSMVGRAYQAFAAFPVTVRLTRRSTSLPSVAGRCAMKPRSAGRLELQGLPQN